MKPIKFRCLNILITGAMLAYAAGLYANSSTAGNPVTVNRESGFNALRSPALMSWQEDDSWGLGFVYTLQAYDNTGGKASSGVITADVSGDSKTVFKGTGLFSMVIKDENHAFGLGIKSSDDSQFAITENTTKMGTFVSDTTKTQINVSSVFSYSYRLGSRYSLGIQAETGYASEKEDKKETGKPDVEITTDTICGSMSAGYSYIGNNVEAGLIISGGEFSRKQGQKLNSTVKSSYDPYFFQSKGYGITAGVAFRPHYQLLIDFETGATIPYEYEGKTFADDASFTLLDTEVQHKGLYLARIGFDYLFNRSISFGTGFTCVYVSFDSSNSNNATSEAGIFMSELTTGAECRLAGDLKLVFCCNLLFLNTDLSMFSPGDPIAVTPDTKIDIDDKKIYVNFVTGVSKSF